MKEICQYFKNVGFCFCFGKPLKPNLVLNLMLLPFKEGHSSRFESLLRICRIFLENDLPPSF